MRARCGPSRARRMRRRSRRSREGDELERDHERDERHRQIARERRDLGVERLLGEERQGQRGEILRAQLARRTRGSREAPQPICERRRQEEAERDVGAAITQRSAIDERREEVERLIEAELGAEVREAGHRAVAADPLLLLKVRRDRVVPGIGAGRSAQRRSRRNRTGRLRTRARRAGRALRRRQLATLFGRSARQGRRPSRLRRRPRTRARPGRSAPRAGIRLQARR